MTISLVGIGAIGTDLSVVSVEDVDVVVPYPSGIQDRDLGLILRSATGQRPNVTPPEGWSPTYFGGVPNNNLMYYKVLDQFDGGSEAVHFNIGANFGTSWVYEACVMVVLRSDDEDWNTRLVTWTGLHLNPYNPSAVAAETDAVIYRGQDAGSYWGDDAGYSVLDHSTFNWDAALTVLADIQFEDTHALATDDARVVTVSWWAQIAVDEFTYGTIPASANSITRDVDPNIPIENRNYIRSDDLIFPKGEGEFWGWGDAEEAWSIIDTGV